MANVGSLVPLEVVATSFLGVEARIVGTYNKYVGLAEPILQVYTWNCHI
jgi:hypothetical protein